MDELDKDGAVSEAKKFKEALIRVSSGWGSGKSLYDPNGDSCLTEEVEFAAAHEIANVLITLNSENLDRVVRAAWGVAKKIVEVQEENELR